MPSISKKRNMLIAEKYLSKNTEMSIESILLQLKMGHLLVSPSILSVSNAAISHIHPYSAYEKSIIIERTRQYIKDRTTKCFNDYFLPYKRKEKCKLKHMIIWFSLFIYFYNKEISVK